MKWHHRLSLTAMIFGLWLLGIVTIKNDPSFMPQAIVGLILFMLGSFFFIFSPNDDLWNKK